MVLAKSSKILPVTFVGYFRGMYAITWANIIVSVIISAGLVIFNSGKMKGLESDTSNYFGIGLVMASLLMDGFSGS